MVTDITKQLLEAGVHFGHQTKRWNPKMAQYIFGQRNGIYIIDLEKTTAKIEEACGFIRDTISRGEYVLFVGTKKQAKDNVIAEAQRCEMFYVTERWLGGLLTNFTTVRSSIKRMKDIERMKQEGVLDDFTKKERAELDKEWQKLNKNLAGVVEMKRLPSALIVIDPKKEETAVKEAKKLSIPIVALIDTNSDPDMVDYPIPGNDDAIRSISIVLKILADSVVEGRKRFVEKGPKQEGAGEDSTQGSSITVTVDDEIEVEKEKIPAASPKLKKPKPFIKKKE